MLASACSAPSGACLACVHNLLEVYKVAQAMILHVGNTYDVREHFNVTSQSAAHFCMSVLHVSLYQNAAMLWTHMSSIAS